MLSVPLLVAAFGFCLSVAIAGPAQLRLLNTIFKDDDYSHLERPVANDSEALLVQISFNVQQIIELDAKEQYMESLLWIEQYWHDAKMTWNPAEYEGISKIRIPATRVWRPDILVYNSADEKFDGTWLVNVVVDNSGYVSYIPPAMIKSTCKVFIKWFPFDEQCCSLRFGSWTYDDSQLNLTLLNQTISLTTYVPNGEFDLVEIGAKRHDKLFEYGIGESENYPYVSLNFHLQRLGLYYTFNLFVPTVLVMAMSILVFSLPAESGEKMGLSITILLSLTVFTTVIADSLPRTSDAVPLLGIYFTIIMAFCSINVIISVFVLNLHHFTHLNSNPPKWVRHGICIRLAKLLWMNIPEELLSGEKPSTADNSRSAALARCAADASCKESYSTNCNDLNVPDLEAGMERLRSLHLDICELPQMNGTEMACNSPVRGESELLLLSATLNSENFRQFCSVQLYLILRELKTLTEKVHTDNRAERIACGWRFAAAVIDRASLCLFSLVTIVTGCIVLFWRPPRADGHGADLCIA